MVTLSGNIHGDHWRVLRSLLPLYQAITTVALENGKSCSFWTYVWLHDDALADVYPALYTHCTTKDISVSQVWSTGLCQILVPRLSA